MPSFCCARARRVSVLLGSAGPAGRSPPQRQWSLIAWNNSAMYAGILVGSAVGGPVLTGLGAPILAFGTAAVAVLGALATTRSITITSRPVAVSP